MLDRAPRATAMLLHGSCKVVFAFPTGRALDLGAAERRLETLPERGVRHKHRIPPRAGTGPSLRVQRSTPPIAIARWSTPPELSIELYGFGAVSIAWSIPVRGEVGELVPLAAALYEHTDLRRTALAAASEVLVHGAGFDVRLVEADAEDYVLFDLELEGGSPGELLERHPRELARLLRAEEGELSEQEIEDALSCRVSYTPGDLTLIDWLGALLLGPETEDEVYVLELATVELAALRHLDRQLETATDEARRALAESPGPLRGLGMRGNELRRIAVLQTTYARLHEGADNPLKLLGDDYLARVYRKASQRFHFDPWDAAIESKLDNLQKIWTRLSELAAVRRAEVLEWIIIVLIAASILVYFVPGRGS